MKSSRIPDPTRLLGLLWVASALWGLLVLFVGPGSISRVGAFDLPLVLLFVLAIAYGTSLTVHDSSPSRPRLRRMVWAADVLLAYALLIAGFLYLFALNANLDYVQRFVRLGGQLQISLNTSTERAIVLMRMLPTVSLAVVTFLYFRLPRGLLFRRLYGSSAYGAGIDLWALSLAILSAVLAVLALPSHLFVNGVAAFGFVALVPLFVAVVHQPPARAIGTFFVFGLAYTIGANFWLATFSLVSIQLSVLVYGSYFLLLGVVAVLFLRLAPKHPYLVLALLWVGFEWIRSLGFLGYPWGLLAHSQYLNRPLIQIADVGGQWAITLVLVMVNAAVAALVTDTLAGRRLRAGMPAVAAGLLLISLGYGYFRMADFGLARDTRIAETRPDARVALVQHNSDPRKARFSDTLDTLISLSDQALATNPDLLAWSETAFVPNIRRWSTDTSSRYFHGLVTRLLDWQAGIDTWLLTGNDDYELLLDDEGEEIDRLNYNAAVLFDAQGNRRQTYRKIRLVPFTEHFPWKEELPAVYELLQDFDVYLWEPGAARTVFDVPGIRFSTPICFEDVFPNEVRAFVREGAEVILNISNDYWSLTPVQARQHFASGILRAVENRRPLLRSTASGITAHVDETGGVIDQLEPYVEDYLVADVYTASPELTLYTRFGDWLPMASIGGLLVLGLVSFVEHRRHRRDT